MKSLYLGLAALLAFLLVLPLSVALGAKSKPPSPALDKMFSSARAQIAEVMPAQAKAMLAKTNKPIMVDVRTLEEFKAGAIPGAMHLDRGKLEFLVEGKIADKGTPILVFCQSGGRGTLATMTLKKMGYINVKNIKGGFAAWQKAGYPVNKAG